MLCYGGGSIKQNGIYEEVMECLKKTNQNIVEFSGIGANPTYSKVLEGGRTGARMQSRFNSRCWRRQRHGLLQSYFHGGSL